MLNKKGQALIEFVLILPIIILLLLGGIDLGRIILSKIELENKVTDEIGLLKNDEITISELSERLNDNDTKIKILENETTSFITIEVEEKITFLTPIVSNILNSYTIKIKRVVAYE